jgi:lysozyme family protein
MPQLNPWINDARADIGKYHDGTDVPTLAMRIATRFPDLAPYCELAKPNTEWCGIMVAEWLSRYDIRPPYTPPGNNKGSFMFADSWADTGWGTHIPIGQEQPGDIAVFRSPHHVTMVSGNGKFVGGNQSDGVTETSFNRSGLRAIIRPPAAGEEGQPNKPKPQQPNSAPVPLNPKLSNFGKCLPPLLKHEGGNDDDPRDPGGRTSRGILQSEWNVWRASHPGLPSDVWEAPQGEIEAIYKQKYWDVLRCDELPSGVDYAVFDYGVNSGNSRGAKVLQRCVGVNADGEIGPLTIGATLRVDPKTLVNQICDERLAFLKSLHTWPTFGGGWSRRVSEVRAAAEAMTTLPKRSTTPPQSGHEEPSHSNGNLAQVDINKQLKAFVQLGSTVLPILSTFVPQLKVLIPILPVLTGLLKIGDDVTQAGNDPAKIADALAGHLKDVAQQVQALKLLGQS